MNEVSIITPQRAAQSVQNRFNPLRSITPQTLVDQLDRWRVGYLREFGLTADMLLERDDTIRTVASKRFKAAARHGWEIVTVDDSPEAQRHRDVLEEFWNNAEVTNAIDSNERGGVRLLARQMMSAVGMRYAVHEMVWKPTASNLGVEFRFAPIWFFEATQGRLRFLKSDFDVTGIDMPEDQWLVTVGDGLMPATSVTWMFKRLPLQDWLVYSEKFGVPGIWGKTDASPGSNGWSRMEEAVAAFTSDMAIVTSKGEEIDTIERKSSSETPFPEMVQRAERNIMALWRGGDLGTMSQQGQAVGSNPQQDETALLEQDDREMLSETLNMQVEPIVIRWHFGESVKPLAYIRFSGFNQRNTDLDIRVDEMLVKLGFPLSQQAAGERYNRTPAAEGEPALKAPAGGAGFTPSLPPLANSAADLKRAGREAVLNAVARDLQPIRARLKAILAIEDADVMKQKLEVLRADLAKLKQSLGADPEMARALEEIMGAEMINAMEAKR